ncbi:MAG: HEAT repeat domain-containing protein [Spirochaetota bacterium]
MEQITLFITSVSFWVYAAAGPVLSGAAAFLVWFFVSRNTLKNRLRMVYDSPEPADRLVTKEYKDSRLLFHSGLIEKVARRNGPSLINLIGIDRLWTDRLAQRPNLRNLKRVLAYASEKGLFTCFLAALKNKGLARHFLAWLEENEDLLVLRKIALSGKGKSFSGRDAFALFQNNIDKVRQMVGDPEWPSRYFALKIMLYDEHQRSERAVWEAFHDSHALIRKTAAAEFVPKMEDFIPQKREGTSKKGTPRHKVYTELFNLLINDPVFEVRETAKKRIVKDFSDLYSVDLESLSDKQALHLLEHLEPDSSEDKNTALSFLSGDNLELRLAAGQYLEKAGMLDKLFLEVSLDDKETLQRSYNLLKKASEVHITSFLENIRKTENPACLYIGSRILVERGEKQLITSLAEKVFKQRMEVPEYRELYTNTVTCACTRGNETALVHICREIERKKNDSRVVKFLLSLLPQRGESVFVPELVKLLKDPEFVCRNALRDALLKFQYSGYIHELFRIIKAGRQHYPHSVRIAALKLLGALRLHYCLEFVLENLHVLPLEEAQQFAKDMAQYSGKFFNQRVRELLNSDDGRIRACLIACLPAVKYKDFMKPVRKALSDADPEVRIAGVKALVEYGDARSFKRAYDLLRDPVERVRVQTAQALAEYGSEKVLENFTDLLNDGNEVRAVKEAAVKGLGRSGEKKSIDILIDNLKQDRELKEVVVQALSEKTSKQDITTLIECMKDAEPSLRERITEVFRCMGTAGEEALVELLQEDIASLKPYISDVLESTGFIDSAIQKLSHRDPQIRRNAAQLLSLIGSVAAFRGIVLAARDPDQDVRVMVARALESLTSDTGADILSKLQQDPDKRVRKYTLWAMERVKAKSL